MKASTQRKIATRNRLEESAGSFGEARTLAHSFPYPYAEARALYELGRLGQQGTDTERAQDQLEQALTIFQRLGASPSIERTQRALTSILHGGVRENEAT